MGTVSALKKKEKEINIDEVLGQAQKKETPKSKVPILEVSDEVKAQATKIRFLKENIEGLQSELDLVGAEFIEAITPIRTEIMAFNGYISSVKIPDTEGKSITVSWIDNYTKIPFEHKENLQNILGDLYDGYIKTELTIKVKTVDEASLKELIRIVGVDNFSRFFEVERSLKPSTKFTQEQHTLPKTVKDNLAGYIKQYKPALKTK